MVDPRYSGASGANQISVSKALELVRNSETGEVHPSVHETLDQAIRKLCIKINSQPEYVMTKDEFAVFNYFRAHVPLNADVARRSVALFWKNFKGEGSG
jgi:hypothetical protein